LRDLYTDDPAILKSIVITGKDYELSGVNIKLSPVKMEKLTLAVVEVNRTRIEVPVDSSILVVVDGKYTWSPLDRLSKESVFISTNQIFSSHPLTLISYQEYTNIDCYKIEVVGDKPIFVGNTILNSNKNYTAVVITR